MRRKAFTAVLAVLLLGTAASADVIRVPQDHDSIRGANEYDGTNKFKTLGP